MNIGITFDLKSDWHRLADDPADVNAEFDKPETLELIISAIESGGHKVVRIGNVEQLLKTISTLDVDFVFNICEGRLGRNRESQVPNLLEMYNIPYLGADGLALGITLDKVMAKKVFLGSHIPTAGFFKADSDNIVTIGDLNFPLIVKTMHEGSSKGIQQASRVTDLKSLNKRVRYIIDTYQQSALVEEFISGTEFTVAVLGNKSPVAMPVVQVSIDGSLELGDQFYTNDRIYSDTLKYICPANISSDLTQTIQGLAVQVYQSVDCRDLGRVDFRVNKVGEPYVLEINPLPSMDPEDVFHLFPQLFGMNFNKIINVILDLALSRNGLIGRTESEILKPFQQEIVV